MDKKNLCHASGMKKNGCVPPYSGKGIVILIQMFGHICHNRLMPNPLPQSDIEASHKHCWHDTGVVFNSYPPWHEQICCHCGERKKIEKIPLYDRKNHGKYLPDI